MTGQDAIKSAGEFNAQIGVTGVVLTKIDGDARGGAALSVVSVVGVPIAFVGSGEKLDDLEPFHADRFVSRMLGMGDVLSLIEKAEEVIDQATRKSSSEDPQAGSARGFPGSAADAQAHGPARQDPGHAAGYGRHEGARRPEAGREAARAHRSDYQFDDARRTQARRHPRRGRRKRVAKGSGTTVEDVNRLLKQFVEMQRMLKMVGQMTGEPIAAAPKKKKRARSSLMK